VRLWGWDRDRTNRETVRLWGWKRVMRKCEWACEWEWEWQRVMRKCEWACEWEWEWQRVMRKCESVSDSESEREWWESVRERERPTFCRRRRLWNLWGISKVEQWVFCFSTLRGTCGTFDVLFSCWTFPLVLGLRFTSTFPFVSAGFSLLLRQQCISEESLGLLMFCGIFS